MKNRLVSALLLGAMLTLSACGAPSVPGGPASFAPAGPREGQFVFTRENFPQLDGSTSTLPLARAIASVLLGETREEVSNLFSFSKTTQSYRMLMWGAGNGGTDLLIAAEPPEVIWQEKEEQGFRWQMAPFAIDALVFVVNKDNPVDSLTTEQIQKIYTGELTNWSQAGGEDLAITPFQRNEEAGSQTAMKKQVMKDLPMMEAPADYARGEMGDLIEAVSAYDGSPSAIGYTMYYYANDMNMADGLKILAVDGVVPNGDTIRSGDYPFLNSYYVVCGEQPSEAAQVLYDWILSPEGQKLAALEGYVPVAAVEAQK